MPDLPPVTLTWLAGHHGVITTAQLHAHGVSRATIRRLVNAGVLRMVTRGVFVVASAPCTLEQRCAVLSASHPAGFVTGPTAGALAGLRRMPRHAALHYSVRHGLHLPDLAGVRWRQSTVIWSIDRRKRPDGIIVASWARLAFDLAADLHQLDHVSVASQLLHEGKVTVEELAAIDRRLGHPGRAGSGVFRRTLASLKGTTPSQSHPEIVLADALRRRDVPVQAQVPVRKANGVTVHLDLAVPDIRWGIELDIHPEHRTPEGQAGDARRRRDLCLVGWQVEVVTEEDMIDSDAIADELVALYGARRRQLASHPSVGEPDFSHSTLG
jgi:hypothetical protein